MRAVPASSTRWPRRSPAMLMPREAANEYPSQIADSRPCCWCGFAAGNRACVRADGADAMEIPHVRRLRCDHRVDDVRDLRRGEASEDHGRLLRRWRWRVGSAERL